MTNHPANEKRARDGTPDVPGSADGEPAVSEAVSDAAASPPSLCHEFANTLHSMLIQVRCAEAAVDQGDAGAVRENLAQIEAAVNDSHRLLRQLRSYFANHQP